MSKKIHGPDGHFYRVSPEGAERQTDQAGAHVAKSVNTGKRKPLTGEVASSATRITTGAPDSSATRIKP